MASSGRAVAQQPAEGFAVERLYAAAPGGGWVVMDDLQSPGGLGGAFTLTGGYAHNPLRLQGLTVVRDRAFVDFGAAVTYERLRVYVNLNMPLIVNGHSGVVGDYLFRGPRVDPGNSPDTLSDTRLGLDARVLGAPQSPFRVGLGAQVIVPSARRSDYLTDGTYRGMARVLFAGSHEPFAYAGHVGVHLRPLDESRVPGSPRGSELLFGVAAGPKLVLDGGPTLLLGVELYGETALRSFFGGSSTAVEALLSGRLEHETPDGVQIRWKIAAGPGLLSEFGAPAWRAVISVEAARHLL